MEWYYEGVQKRANDWSITSCDSGSELLHSKYGWNPNIISLVKSGTTSITKRMDAERPHQ